MQPCVVGRVSHAYDVNLPNVGVMLLGFAPAGHMQRGLVQGQCDNRGDWSPRLPRGSDEHSPGSLQASRFAGAGALP